MHRTLSTVLFLLGLSSAIYCISAQAETQTSFSLIEQHGEGTIFLMVSEQDESAFIHVGMGTRIAESK